MTEEAREAARRKSRRLAGLNPVLAPPSALPSGSQSADESGQPGTSYQPGAQGGSARRGTFHPRRRGHLVRPSPYARRTPPQLTPQRRTPPQLQQTPTAPPEAAGTAAGEPPAVIVSPPDSDDGSPPGLPLRAADARPHTVVTGTIPPVGVAGGRGRRSLERSVPGAVQGESFCRCTQQSQTRDLQCTCGEEEDGRPRPKSAKTNSGLNFIIIIFLLSSNLSLQ